MRTRPRMSALIVMSTEFVIAHSPTPFGMGAPHPALRAAFPSQHCDLRFKLHCDLRSSVEGSVAHQNFYVNITRARRNRILTIGIRISRQCPPQARPMVAPAFFFPLRTNSRARRDEARRRATKHDEGRPVIAAKAILSFLIERNNSVQ